jgi:hypothetical protein
MSTRDFAQAAGVSAASISKLIRDGRLKAKKEGGKWLIPKNQLGSEAVRALKAPSQAGQRKPAGRRQARKTDRVSARRPPAPGPSVAPEPEPARSPAPPAPVAAAPPVTETRPGDKTFTIAEFAEMTYLTEKGVAEWLKSGRIQGVQKEDGEWRVLDRNLQVPDISRLLRK